MKVAGLFVVAVLYVYIQDVWAMKSGTKPPSPSDIEPILPALTHSKGKSKKGHSQSHSKGINHTPSPPSSTVPTFTPPPTQGFFRTTPSPHATTSTPLPPPAHFFQTGPASQRLLSLQQDVENQLQRLNTKLALANTELSHLEQQLDAVVGNRRNFALDFTNRLSSLELTTPANTDPPTNTDPALGFSAIVSKNLTGLGHLATVPFGVRIENVGGGYNIQTDKFRCAVRGLYLFWVTLNSEEPNGSLLAEIVVNGTRKSLVHAGGITWIGGVGSSSVVIQLNRGDLVWVRLYNSTGTKVSLWWTTFSGYLIQQMY